MNKSEDANQSDKGAALAMVPPQTVADLIMDESIDQLRSHFRLTPAEARLALHLVTGETLRSAAVKLGISYETTRSSLKKIFAKTRTCRQAELVIVILTALPGCVRAPQRVGLNEHASSTVVADAAVKQHHTSRDEK